MAENKPFQLHSTADSDYETLNSFSQSVHNSHARGAEEAAGNVAEAGNHVTNGDPVLDQISSMVQDIRLDWSASGFGDGRGSRGDNPRPAPRQLSTMSEGNSPDRSLENDRQRPVPAPRSPVTLPSGLPLLSGGLRQNSCPPNIQAWNEGEGQHQQDDDIDISLADFQLPDANTLDDTGDGETTAGVESFPGVVHEGSPHSAADGPPLPLREQSSQDSSEERLQVLWQRFGEHALTQEEMVEMIRLLGNQVIELKQADTEKDRRLDAIERQVSNLSSRTDQNEQTVSSLSGNFTDEKEHTQRQRHELNNSVNENSQSIATIKTNQVKTEQTMKDLKEKNKRFSRKQNYSNQLHKETKAEIKAMKQSQSAQAISTTSAIADMNMRTTQSEANILYQYEGLSASLTEVSSQVRQDRQLRNDIHEVVPEVPGTLDYQADDDASDASNHQSDGEDPLPEEEEHADE